GWAAGMGPRQICPPRAGLSSRRVTPRPASAATAAAARPAGPAPTTSTGLGEGGRGTGAALWESGIWQVRRWGTPETVARHSKQMPMPQRGPRGSPLTERREGVPAAMAAAAIVLNPGSGVMGDLAIGKIGLGGDGRRGAAESGGAERAHVLLGAAQHATQHGVIYPACAAFGGLRPPPPDGRLPFVLRRKLTRGADEDLAGGAGLGVEGDRVAIGSVGALEVAELDQLMAEPAGIAVGDEQVALARADGEAGGEAGRGRAAGVNDHAGGEHGAVGERGPAMADGSHRRAQARDDAGALEQPARGTGRIAHRIAGDEERTGEAGPKIGLGGGERGGIE